MSEAAEAAIELSEALGGCHVFPIEPGTKGEHYGRSWAKAASADPEVIRKRFAWAESKIKAGGYKNKSGDWVEIAPGTPNIGIACKPSGLVVVDIDNKGGLKGDETWAKLTEGVTIYTRTHTTPSGGRHVFFHSDEELPNAQGWAPGLDLRAAGGEFGGYVLVGEVDGAELGDGFEAGTLYPYDVELDIPIAAMPGMLAQAIQASQAGPSLDMAGTTHYSELVEQFVEMKEGEGRNATFTAICGHLRNWLPHDDAFRLTAYLVASSSKHPLPEREITKTILSIEKATIKEIKALTEGEEALGQSWAATSHDDMFALWSGTVEPILPEVLTRSDGVHAMYLGETHIFFGESGVGKSWVLIEAARQEVLKGNPVLYIDQESSGHVMRLRLGAMGLLDFVDTNGEIHPGEIPPVDLAELFAYRRAETGFTLKADGTFESDRVIDDLMATVELYKPTLVVMDGLTDAFQKESLDTNQGAEVTAYYKKIFEPIAREFNCAVAGIDHVTKDRERQGEAIGSIHKTAGVTGASYGIHSLPGEPRVGKNQQADLWLSGRKDRLGGAQDSMPMEAGLPVWGVVKMRPECGRMKMTIDPFTQAPENLLYKSHPWARAAETMADRLVEMNMLSMERSVGKTDLLQMAGGGKDAYKRQALVELERLGVVVIEKVGRKDKVWLAADKGWRIQHDDRFKPE